MVALAASAVRSGYNYAVLEAGGLEGYVSLYGQYSKEREGFTRVASTIMMEKMFTDGALVKY